MHNRDQPRARRHHATGPSPVLAATAQLGQTFPGQRLLGGGAEHEADKGRLSGGWECEKEAGQRELQWLPGIGKIK